MHDIYIFMQCAPISLYGCFQSRFGLRADVEGEARASGVCGPAFIMRCGFETETETCNVQINRYSPVTTSRTPIVNIYIDLSVGLQSTCSKL